jgi:hypothetical protein
MLFHRPLMRPLSCIQYTGDNDDAVRLFIESKCIQHNLMLDWLKFGQTAPPTIKTDKPIVRWAFAPSEDDSIEFTHFGCEVGNWILANDRLGVFCMTKDHLNITFSIAQGQPISRIRKTLEHTYATRDAIIAVCLKHLDVMPFLPQDPNSLVDTAMTAIENKQDPQEWLIVLTENRENPIGVVLKQGFYEFFHEPQEEARHALPL